MKKYLMIAFLILTASAGACEKDSALRQAYLDYWWSGEDIVTVGYDEWLANRPSDTTIRFKDSVNDVGTLIGLGSKIQYIAPTRDSLLPFSPDTSRFYPKVDTVLTWVWDSCEYVYWVDDSDIIKVIAMDCLPIYALDSLTIDGPKYVYYRRHIRTVDTTWLPKVQLFLDSAEYKRLMQLLYPPTLTPIWKAMKIDVGP